MMSRLSETYRINHYRQMLVVPNEYFNSDFQVEIATTQEDLQSAYTLLHDSYVGIRIIDPQPSGLRCNVFTFLPTTTVVVAKHNGRVIGTVSLIKDSNSGLPSDREFPEENNALRRQGKSLVEISALAVAPEYRGKHTITFLLTAFLYTHCREYFACDYMLAAVHPKTETFYKALMGFVKNGKPLDYSSLKGAAAIHVSMDLSEAHLEKLTNSFKSKDPAKNFGLLLQLSDKRFFHLTKKNDLQISPVITPNLLKFFCLQQKEIWSRLSSTEQQTLIQVYSTYFGMDSVKEFLQVNGEIAATKQYRTPVHINALITADEQSKYFGRILDLNSGGCFLICTGELPKPGQKIKIAFRFANNEYRLQAQVVWQNQGQAIKHHPNGVGIQFDEKIEGLNQDLKEWIYNALQPENVPNHAELQTGS